jgi:hypothetical protein
VLSDVGKGEGSGVNEMVAPVSGTGSGSGSGKIPEVVTAVTNAVKTTAGKGVAMLLLVFLSVTLVLNIGVIKVVKGADFL